MLAATFPLLDDFLTILWVFLFAFWIWTLISVLLDLFRSHDHSGMAKAVWFLFIVVLPFFGVLAYLLLHGEGMANRSLQRREAGERAFRGYLREAAGHPESVADELVKLGDLHDRGVLNDEEYERLRGRLVA